MTRRPASRLCIAVALLCMLAVAFAVRLEWVRHVDDPFDNQYSDMAFYVARARWLVAGTIPEFPRELGMYPPGTHTLYAAEIALIGWSRHTAFLVAHCLWGALVAPCVMLLSLRVVRSLWVAFPVGLLMAVWQPQVVYSGFFSSEQFACGLFAVSAWLLVRHAETGRGAIVTGLVAGTTYLVRPQFLLTVALLGGAWLLAAWRRPALAPRPRWGRTAIAAALMGAFVAGGAIRYASIAERPGLIADEDALQRLFADTDVGKVQSGMGGRHWVFVPPSKMAVGEMREYSFDGYIGDRDKLEQGRRLFLRGRSLEWRAKHLLSNIDLLVERNWLWPESDHVNREPWRRRYSEDFESLLHWLLPLAALGLLSALWRRTPVLLVAAAYVATVVVVAALFWGEMRYRVPYDGFLIILSLEGARLLVSGAWRLVRSVGLLAFHRMTTR